MRSTKSNLNKTKYALDFNSFQSKLKRSSTEFHLQYLRKTFVFSSRIRSSNAHKWYPAVSNILVLKYGKQI